MEEWIKKSDVVKALNTEAREQFRLDDSYAYVIGTLRNVEDAISNIPSADRPQGEWIVSCKDSICPICGKDEAEFICGTEDWYGYGLSNYCPNCGARMKGADDE